MSYFQVKKVLSIGQQGCDGTFLLGKGTEETTFSELMSMYLDDNLGDKIRYPDL